jgi:hypothetical protein
LLDEAVSAATVSAVTAEGEDTWKTFLLDIYRRGLIGQNLRLVVTDGQKERLKRSPSPGRGQRINVAGRTNCATSARLKRSQQSCVDEARAIYQAGTRLQAIQEFPGCKTAGAKKLQKRCVVWKSSLCWSLWIVRRSCAKNSARPTLSSDYSGRSDAAFAPCAPLRHEPPVKQPSSASLIEEYPLEITPALTFYTQFPYATSG